MTDPYNSQNKRKLVIGTGLFLALTVGIFWYQFSQIQSEDVGPTWSGLNWRFGLLLILCWPLEPLFTGARLWLVCRVLQPGLSFWTSMKADLGNIAMAMLTPSQTGGGPAQVYLLIEGGATLSTAFTISVISFMGTLIGLLCIGLYAVNYAGEAMTGTLFTAAVWTVTIFAAVAMVMAIVPNVFRAIVAPISRTICRVLGLEHRIVDWRTPSTPEDAPADDRMERLTGILVTMLYAYKNDTIRFLKHGKLAFIGVVLTTLLFMGARGLMAYLSVRFLGLEADFLLVMKVQFVLLFIIYFAPTPGSAGIAEGASLAAMAAMVPAGFAPYYNMLWRSTTIYISAAIGIFILIHASLKPRTKQEQPAPDAPDDDASDLA